VTHDGGEGDTGCQSVDEENENSDNALTGGEDDTEDVMSEVMSIPDSETLKDISEALYDDVKAEYVNELDDKAHDTLHAAIHYISVFYQVVRQREKDEPSGVRGRQEIREKLEEIEEDVKKLEKQLEDSDGDMREMVLAKVLNEYQMALDVLYWVLGEVDDL